MTIDKIGIICGLALLVSACASPEKTTLELNMETAIDTCGGEDQVEAVTEEGFTCKD